MGLLAAEAEEINETGNNRTTDKAISFLFMTRQSRSTQIKQKPHPINYVGYWLYYLCQSGPNRGPSD